MKTNHEILDFSSFLVLKKFSVLNKKIVDLAKKQLSGFLAQGDNPGANGLFPSLAGPV